MLLSVNSRNQRSTKFSQDDPVGKSRHKSAALTRWRERLATRHGGQKPSWYLHVTDDRMVPIAAQRFMSECAGSKTSEVPGSHVVYVSNPGVAAALIKKPPRAQIHRIGSFTLTISR